MPQIVYTGFVSHAVQPEQQRAIAAFKELALGDPDLARQALGLGDSALHAVIDDQAEELVSARAVVDRLLTTRADLELGVATLRPAALEDDPRYASALWQWRIANWSSRPKYQREAERDERRRTLRLGILLQAALQPAPKASTRSRAA